MSDNLNQALRIPNLTTQRLQLVPISMAHSQGMFELWSDASVCEFSGEVRDAAGQLLPMPAPSQAVSDKIVEFWLQAATTGWGFRWAVLLKGTQQFVGTVGFNALAPVAEVAYHQLPSQWGQGYMSEATAASLVWLDQEYHPRAVEAYIEPPNRASIALVERLGFSATEQFESGARRYVKPTGAG